MRTDLDAVEELGRQIRSGSPSVCLSWSDANMIYIRLLNAERAQETPAAKASRLTLEMLNRKAMERMRRR